MLVLLVNMLVFADFAGEHAGFAGVAGSQLGDQLVDQLNQHSLAGRPARC